jgi:hypothetical protein
MLTTDLVIPESLEVAENLPSDLLYKLEIAGEISKEILDRRVIEWADEDWTQSQMADELGCSQQAVSKRMKRLGVQPSQPHAPRDITYNRVVSSDPPEYVEPDEVLPPATESTNTGPVTVAGIKFPSGGIAARDDVSEYSVQDLKRVLNELVRRATPQEAKALCQLLVHYAEEAERKVTP